MIEASRLGIVQDFVNLKNQKSQVKREKKTKVNNTEKEEKNSPVLLGGGTIRPGGVVDEKGGGWKGWKAGCTDTGYGGDARRNAAETPPSSKGGGKKSLQSGTALGDTGGRYRNSVTSKPPKKKTRRQKIYQQVSIRETLK